MKLHRSLALGAATSIKMIKSTEAAVRDDLAAVHRIVHKLGLNEGGAPTRHFKDSPLKEFKSV